MVVFISELTSEVLKGEVQIARVYFYAVLVETNGKIVCPCLYTEERGVPCDHSVKLIDQAYRETLDPVWDLTDKKW